MAATYDLGTIVAAHEAVVAEWDAAGSSCYINVCNSANGVLATVLLSYPCGTVSPTTGQLSLNFNGRDEDAASGGTAHHIDIKDHAGVARCSVPCVESPTPVSGFCAMVSTTVVEGAPFEVSSVTFG